jgi:hypothetical protein
VDDLEARLEDVTRAAMERWRVPGVALGLLHGGREVQAGFGGGVRSGPGRTRGLAAHGRPHRAARG